MFSGLKSMANTPMEAESSGSHDGEPSYPFNLSMTLDNSQLEKLECDTSDDDCKVGNCVQIKALAEIVGIHKVDTGDGEKVTLCLQVTHMEICDEDKDDQDGDSSY